MRRDALWPATLEQDRAVIRKEFFSLQQPTVNLPLPVLHGGQLKLAEQLGAARFGFVLAGRRSGKTWYAIRRALEYLQRGKQVGWLSATNKIMHQAWRDLKQITAVASPKISEQDRRIEIGRGVIECWSMEAPFPAQGRSYHHLVVDEAGLIRALQDIWQTSLRATLSQYKGTADFLGTPKGMSGQFVQMWRKAQAQAAGWEHTAAARIESIDSPYMDAEEIEAARRELPPEIFDQEYRGIPAESAANPFGLKAIEECVAPLSADSARIWGWDFARAEDYTVGIALDLSGTVCRFERWHRVSWAETRARVKQLTGDVYAVGDSTGLGDVIVEDLTRDGVRMEPYNFTKPSKQALMERLSAAIQQGTVKFPDGIIRAELEQFEYEYFGGSIRYTCGGDHDDTVMALALAVYGYDRLGLARQWHRLVNAKPAVPFDNWDPEVLARAALESRRITEPKKLLPAKVPITTIEAL